MISFAVLIAGILLSVGLGVSTILIKEITLASAGRDSQFAFYSADAAGECALFYDAKQNIFPTSTDSLTYSGPMTCAGTSIPTPLTSVRTSSAATTTFTLNNPSYCAVVTVAKWGGNTKVESEGFNTCDTTNTRRVERALRISY